MHEIFSSFLTGTPTSRTSTWAINLETSSPAFKRIGHFSDSFYYAALRIVASANGTYTLKSRSSIDTFACLYGGAFNPFDTNTNLLQIDDDKGGQQQFRLRTTMQSPIPFILAVTTNSPSITGAVTIQATGPGDVSFRQGKQGLTNFRQISSCHSRDECKYEIVYEPILSNTYRTQNSFRA